MKRIITCSDGTWNKPNTVDDNKPVRTNVQKTFDYIQRRDAQGVLQIKYYDEGVGAEGGVLKRMLDGATGKGIDDNILDAYKFIIWNYEPGDEIFLFGFSRGAYTARSVAGLIRKCGILIKNDLNLISEAYEIYRTKELKHDSPRVLEFRKKNCFEPEIKFIGVWDTVGALGIPLKWFQMSNRKKYRFHDTTLSSIIDHAYHALSVDEMRSTFKPTLWQQHEDAKLRAIAQVLEQRWFAGVHSNVGGGYQDEGLADIALKWILEKSRNCGLALDESLVSTDIKAKETGQLYNSRGGLFKILPPYLRPIDTKNTSIDESVFARIKEDSTYRPKNIKW